MPDVLVITEAELRQVIQLDDSMLDVVGRAFSALATGDAVMPPIMRLDVHDHNGEIDVKSAYLRGFDSFAVKMSPGFFDNPKLGLPSVAGLMVLFSARTGMLEALLLDNGYLTDVRTAAAGGLAARHLARGDARTAGVLGTGTQARLQAQALTLARDLDRLLVWGRDEAKAAAYAAEMSQQLGTSVEVRESAEAVVREADVVVTTTPSRDPLIQADWLHPGLHITAIGADAEHKTELAPGVVAVADLFVCDTRAQSARLGELHHAILSGAVAEDMPVVEIGSIVSGRQPGRTNDDEITVCDLTGTGAQDTAIALHAFRTAQDGGQGQVITN